MATPIFKYSGPVLRGGPQKSTTNFEVIREACRICGHANLRRSTDEPITKCNNCHHLLKETTDTFHSDENPKANYSTHNQVRWGCRTCGHTGIRWVKKGTKLSVCPHCGEQPWGLAKGIIDPKGRCATIWEPVQGIKRPLIRTQLPKKKHRCGNCGFSVPYLVRYPAACPRCGNEEW